MKKWGCLCFCMGCGDGVLGSMEIMLQKLNCYGLLDDVQGIVYGGFMVLVGVVLLMYLGFVIGQMVGLVILISYVMGWSFGLVFFVVNLLFYWLGYC